MSKTPLNINVLEAARERLRIVFEDFPRVYVSFSGGKDSGVMLELAIEAARAAGRLPLDVLVVDLEAQYTHTMSYVERQLSRPEVRGWWVCLPLNLRNAVSQHQPFWMCWEPGQQEKWVRPMPTHEAVVNDPATLPFFRPGMEFEEFTPAFGEWFSRGERTACLVGIRTDESLNRFRTIARDDKERWRGYAWTTRLPGTEVYNAYPIYDWRTADIWTANGRFGWDYNRAYDLMHLAGLSIHQMRLCQPYGDDQRKGLWLYRVMEPDTWARVVARVEGANFGARYSSKGILGHLRVDLPEGHTWESYGRLLLRTMPPHLAAHYIGKINTYFRWWALHCGGRTQHQKVEAEDDRFDAMGIYINDVIPYDGYTGEGPDTPAWRDPPWKRICRVLLKNDYWCKGIGFQQTTREREALQRLALEAFHAAQ